LEDILLVQQGIPGTCLAALFLMIYQPETQNMNEPQMITIEPVQPEAHLSLQEALGPKATRTLTRMFRDPRVLDQHERADLVATLAQAVDLAPHVPEVRVMLGMALCVNLQAQEAMEQLREAARRAPNSFIARLKLGELLMRLRICDQAEEHTHQAALLATNDVQAELARRQAAWIRQMRREGIERGAYSGLLSWTKVFTRQRKSQTSVSALAVSE